MVNEELLKEYSNNIKNLRKQCKDAGMSDDEFMKLYFESITSLEITDEPQVQNRRSMTKYYILFLGLIITAFAVYNFKSIYSCIVCNVQEYIYPGLRLLRKITIPIISLFPALTDFYHETCLIHNPFFTVVDMDCWPCSTVSNVGQVAHPKPVTQQQTAPFIYETEQQVIDLESLGIFYKNHKNLFDNESSKILTNGKYYISPSELFSPQQMSEKSSYVWKFNNMNLAKVLRQVIPRPKVVPKFGQSTERFLIIDTSQESLRIPDTECSFSFLLALSGSRTIELVPAEECKHQCKSLKVELKETNLLWYNWWYWRPKLQPSFGNVTLIAHLGSYC